MKNNSCFFLVKTVILAAILVTLSHAGEAKSFVYPIYPIYPIFLSLKSADPLANTTKSNMEEISFTQLKALSLSGHRKDAIAKAIIYLNKYPTDGDVRVLLGQMYFASNENEKARQQLLIVLQQTPNNLDASLVLINVETTQANYQEALGLANYSLFLNPTDPDLLKKKSYLVHLISLKKSGSSIVSAGKTEPRPLGNRYSLTNAHRSDLSAKRMTKANKTEKLLVATKKNEEKIYLNEVGFNQQQYYISDVKSVWDYSTLYYGRVTPIGKVYGKINYSNRFSKEAIQGEIEAYPKINKYIYLDLDVAYANQPNLFASQVYGAEAYVAVKRLFDFSLGGKYNSVDSRHKFSMYTGSLSKVISNNLILFRPYYFVPGVGKSSILYSVNLRHIIRDPFFYFGCVFGLGKSPDLADLTTVNFIVVQNKIVNPYINFPLFNERLIVNLGLLYQNQLFPNNLVRNWSGGTVALAWKF